MAKIPKSAKKEIPQKCKVCGKVFKSKEYLVYHIEKHHAEEIPEGWSASRYENYLRTGKTHGQCVVCKKETEWNESTWKYARLCDNPKCRQSISNEADKNMIGKYGKTTLLNDAEQQRKMIYAKKNSGTYYWSTDTAKKFPMHYASSVEYKFLEMLDVFLGLEPEDVMSPSPNNYTYKYEGKNHLYIPDVYIISLNLEIELKEPSDNQNMHPKIQAVDKVKERLKDEVMESVDYVNYIKVNGTDYTEFFRVYTYLKNKEDNQKSNTKSVMESIESMDTSDIDAEIADIILDMEREPVVEKMNGEEFIRIASTIQSSLKDIISPGLNYNKTLKEFEEQVDTCTSLSAAKVIKKNMSSYKRYLEKISRDKSDVLDPRELEKYSNLKYEAGKAIKTINALQDKLDNKMKKLRKAGGEYYVTEGYLPDGWYKPVDESYITAYKNDTMYKPVFIFLSYTDSNMAKLIKNVTNGTFSHASLSLDTSMKKMFSFNAHGFVDEDIHLNEFLHTGSHYSVYMYIAPKIEYDVMDDIISKFQENKDKLKYSIRGLFNYLTNHKTTYSNEWFCSEFVSYVLSEANPKLFKRHYSLYSPDDLTNTRKFIKVYSGSIAEYDENIINREIRKILNRKGFEHVDIENK